MSNETKWTPGPWRRFHILDKGQGRHVVAGDKALHVSRCAMPALFCDGGVETITPTERDANAHLIAAAPELYQALEAAVMQAERILNGEPPEEGGDFDGWFLSAKAALAKTRGES